jgi:hypothetical protein
LLVESRVSVRDFADEKDGLTLTKPKNKDSLVWLEELVEAAKAWRASLTEQDLVEAEKDRATDPHQDHVANLAQAVDGYRQAIKDEVEAELENEEKEM